MSREVMQQALDVLEFINKYSMAPHNICLPGEIDDAMDALRKRLAQPEQEPYGRVTVVRRPGCVDQHWFYRWPEPPYLDNAAECHTLYTTPQPAQRQPLTNAQIAKALAAAGLEPEDYREDGQIEPLIRVIEAAHGIKEQS